MTGGIALWKSQPIVLAAAAFATAQGFLSSIDSVVATLAAIGGLVLVLMNVYLKYHEVKKRMQEQAEQRRAERKATRMARAERRQALANAPRKTSKTSAAARKTVTR